MAIFTPTELAEQIAAYKAALLALATHKSYTINTGAGSRTVTKQDLPEIRNTLEYLKREQAELSGQHGPTFVTMRPVR